MHFWVFKFDASQYKSNYLEKKRKESTVLANSLMGQESLKLYYNQENVIFSDETTL